MPENETLFRGAGGANRWRAASERMDGGQSPIEAFPEIQDQFYSCFRRVWRQWKDCGVAPCQLFDAALNDPAALEDLIRRTRHDGNARLLRDVANGLEAPDLEGLLRAFLDAAWEAPRDELRLDCREDALHTDFVNQVEVMLERMLRGLLHNPSKFPSRPSRKEPPPDLDTRLGESLL